MKNKSPILSVVTTSAFWLALIINTISGISRSMVKQPTTLLGDDLGLTASMLGFVASGYTIFALLSRGPFGQALDNSKKPQWILFGSNIIMAAVFFGFGVCNSVPLFVVLRLLHGFCFGMANMAMAVVLSKSCDRRALGSAFGLFVLIPKVISSYTNNISLWLKEAAGVEYCAYIGAGLAVVCGLLCLLIKFNENEQTGAARKKGISFKTMFYTKAFPICIIFILLQVPSLATNEFIVLFGNQADMGTAAASYVANQGIWMGIGSFVFGYLMDKLDLKGGKILTIVVIACAAVASFIVGSSLSPAMWLVSGVLCGIGSGGASLIRSLALRESSTAVAAVAVGTFAAAQDLTSIAASSIIGMAVDAIGYQTSFLILGAAPLIGLVLTLFFFEKFIAYMDQGEVKSEAN